MNNWPKHPDGRPMTIGEMTPEQRREQFRLACQRLKGEFSNPLVQEKIAAVLDGNNVKQ